MGRLLPGFVMAFVLSGLGGACAYLDFPVHQISEHDGNLDNSDASANPGFHTRRFLRRHSLTLGHSYRSLLEGEAPLAEQWFSQWLDHAHPTDQRQWKQRFFVNPAHYRKGGPAFLMIGGEGEASAVWMNQGTWIEYAKEFGAICFQLEHRFYGKSHPTEDMSVKNLTYLTSEQALADLAFFVTSMTDQYRLTGAKWIAFGGSYPGSLAAWFRLKYPHLVHGAVSTSAPLHAKTNFFEYLEVVKEALVVTDKDCFPTVVEAMNTVKSLVTHNVGWPDLTRDFDLCTPFASSKAEDLGVFMEVLAGYFEGVVQYNEDNREFEGVKNTNVTIKTLCDIMTAKHFNGSDPARSPYHRLNYLSRFMLNMTGEKCFDYSYASLIKEFQNVSWASSSAEGGRQWMYQTCTEFGWYQTSEQVGKPWSNTFPESFWEKQCADVFGPKYNADLVKRGVERTNRVYGGKDIRVSNVVFVHGSVDPWHAMGVTKDVSDSATAIYIEGTAHCANMYPERTDDLPQLKMSRKLIAQKIEHWLKKQ